MDYVANKDNQPLFNNSFLSLLLREVILPASNYCNADDESILSCLSTSVGCMGLVIGGELVG